MNPAAPVLAFASTLLSGEIARHAGRMEEALSLLRAAVGRQDSLVYDEPPPWYGSARQYLGAALHEIGRHHEAAAVYRENLARFPENGWALYGLARCLEALQAKREAGQVEARFKET